MSNASKEIGKPEAIDIIYKEVMEVYNRNNKKSKSVSDEQVKKIDTQENEEKQVKTIGIKNKK